MVLLPELKDTVATHNSYREAAHISVREKLNVFSDE